MASIYLKCTSRSLPRKSFDNTILRPACDARASPAARVSRRPWWIYVLKHYRFSLGLKIEKNNFSTQIHLTWYRSGRIRSWCAGFEYQSNHIDSTFAYISAAHCWKSLPPWNMTLNSLSWICSLKHRYSLALTYRRNPVISIHKNKKE